MLVPQKPDAVPEQQGCHCVNSEQPSAQVLSVALAPAAAHAAEVELIRDRGFNLRCILKCELAAALNSQRSSNPCRQVCSLPNGALAICRALQEVERFHVQ